SLVEMGADISAFKQCLGGRNCRFSSHSYPHSIVVKGPSALSAKTINIPDLRAGFAYVMAALLASGTSIITGLPFLDRGYENLAEKLSSIGADVERVYIEERYTETPVNFDTPYVLV